MQVTDLREVSHGVIPFAAQGRDLTLYELTGEMLEAVGQVEDAQRRVTELAVTAKEGDPELAEARRELELAEQALQAYVTAECKKVDRIAGFIRWCKACASETRAERDRQAERVRMWDARLERIEAMVMGVMRTFGVTRYETAVNTLRRQKNGGTVAPIVERPEIVPGKFQRAHITMRLDHWELIQAALPSDFPTIPLIKFEAEVMPSAISAELKGGRAVAGAREGERGEHLRCE